MGNETVDERRIRVLYVLGPGEMAGIQRHVQGLLTHLPQWVEPQVIFLFGDGAGSKAIAEGGIHIDVLRGRNGHDLRLAFEMAATLHRFQPDIVHMQESHLLPIVLMGFFRRPVVVQTEHCSLTQFTTLWKTRVLYWMLRRRGARVLAVSRATARSILEMTSMKPDRVRVVPNSIDLSSISNLEKPGIRGALSLDESVPLVGAVGRLVNGKGWLDFLEVCRIIAERLSDPHFVVVGEGPLENELRAIANGPPLRGRVHFLGARSDGPAITSELDVFLMTSIHEELPTTVLEAFALGTPVAGFLPEGGTVEILEAAGEREICLLNTERDHIRGAGDVQRLIEDRELSSKLAHWAKETVEGHFSMAVTAQKTADFYWECMGDRV